MKKSLVILGLMFFIVSESRAQSAGSLDASANNAQGQYQPMDMGYAGFSSLGMTQAAWLDPLQNLGEGQTKPAYSKYYWNKDLVLPIRLRDAMVTIINFPEWEMIESVQFGDGNSFSGNIVGPNSVLLWPKGNIGVDTNVIMFGRSGNKYVFYIKSESVDTERLTNAIVDIEIPEDSNISGSQDGVSGGGFFSSASGKTQSATRRFQKKDWLKEIPFSPENLRFDMEVYVPSPDDVVIAPERVWRDDIFTYIDLGEKALTMVQRPIVTQIVERSEIPVGFRTKGPDNRLIIVEGIGDFVLRNGKRMICLKIRRDDAKGVDGYTSYEDTDKYGQEWDVPPTLPDFLQSSSSKVITNKSQGAVSGSGAANAKPVVQETYIGFDDYINSHTQKGSSIPVASVAKGVSAASLQQGANGFDASASSGPTDIKSMFIEDYSYDALATQKADANNISLQLGTGDDISQLEDLWAALSAKYADTLGGYEPYFSVDAPADGNGKELYHLRVGPITSLEVGDNICGHLGRKGVFCSVVRTQ